jgi:hypothetical protein
MNWICPNPNITRIYISLKFSAWVNEYPPVGLINKLFSEDYLSGMTIEQIKKETESLSFSQQGELAAFLVQLRNRQNPDYMIEMQGRIEDTDSAHWLSPDEFEKRIGAE